jgi:hypothetical protein
MPLSGGTGTGSQGFKDAWEDSIIVSFPLPAEIAHAHLDRPKTGHASPAYGMRGTKNSTTTARGGRLGSGGLNRRLKAMLLKAGGFISPLPPSAG